MTTKTKSIYLNTK